MNNRINQNTQILLTIVTAIIILVVIGLAYWLLKPTPPLIKNETPVSSSQEWPTIPPLFTPTPSATVTPLATVTPSATATPTATPIVVGWHELGYLTSVEYTLQTAVEVERNNNESILSGLLGKDRIVLLAVGNVEAGIDMTQIEVEDIEINGTYVSIKLPPAQVSSVELLPAQTQIFDSERKWLVSEYEGLEVEALDQARTELELWAVNQNNVLGVAEKLAISQLEDFLRQLGFEEITISIKE